VYTLPVRVLSIVLSGPCPMLVGTYTKLSNGLRLMNLVLHKTNESLVP